MGQSAILTQLARQEVEFNERGTSSTSDDRTETFGYDALNRLDTATTDSWSRTLTTDYDDFGNLSTKTSNISGDLDVTSFGYAATGKPNRLTSATIGGVSNTFVYDTNGNITSYDAASGDDTFVDYDAANRATKITVGSSPTDSTPTGRDEFWYGPDGERFLRRATWMNGATLETSWTLYLLGGVFEEVHPEFDPTVDYRQRVQVTDTVIHRYYKKADSSVGTDLNYSHRDHLGSVSILTSASGVVVESMGYDPFGGRRESDWSRDITQSSLDDLIDTAIIYTGRGFTDHEHLNRTGIVHMNGRIYDPRIGRFLQPDPIVQSPGFSQSYNRYAYVLNSPTSFVDPSGFNTTCAGGLDCTGEEIFVEAARGVANMVVTAQRIGHFRNRTRVTEFIGDFGALAALIAFGPDVVTIAGVDLDAIANQQEEDTSQDEVDEVESECPVDECMIVTAARITPVEPRPFDTLKVRFTEDGRVLRLLAFSLPYEQNQLYIRISNIDESLGGRFIESTNRRAKTKINIRGTLTVGPDSGETFRGKFTIDRNLRRGAYFVRPLRGKYPRGRAFIELSVKSPFDLGIQAGAINANGAR